MPEAYDVAQDIRQQSLDRAINLAANGRIQPDDVLDRAGEFASFVLGAIPTPDQIESAQELANIATRALLEGNGLKFAETLDTLYEECKRLNDENQSFFLQAEFLNEVRENLDAPSGP